MSTFPRVSTPHPILLAVLLSPTLDNYCVTDDVITETP